MPGLAERSQAFLDAEEVLTDSKGEFMVGKNPPVSWIPGTWVSEPYIVVFKPGYGSFPLHQVNPPPRLGLDKLNELLEHHAVIELPRLKTREERIKVVRDVSVVGVPNDRKPNLERLRELEYSELYPSRRR
jgi:hypothetical protein